MRPPSPLRPLGAPAVKPPASAAGAAFTRPRPPRGAPPPPRGASPPPAEAGKAEAGKAEAGAKEELQPPVPSPVPLAVLSPAELLAQAEQLAYDLLPQEEKMELFRRAQWKKKVRETMKVQAISGAAVGKNKKNKK